MQLTDLLVSSFYRKSGWMRWIYPIVRLGIQEDLKQRLNSRKPYYACLAAVEADSYGPKGGGFRHSDCRRHGRTVEALRLALAGSQHPSSLFIQPGCAI
jgi:hypothetical protein